MHNVEPALGHPQDTFTPPLALGEPIVLSLAQHSPGLLEVATRWRPTDAERRRLAEGEDVYVVFLTQRDIPIHRVCVGAETVRKSPPLDGAPVVEVTQKELPL